MPAPIILQDQSGLGQGIATAGSALSQALGTRMQQNRQQQGLSAFQEGLGEAGNDPQAIMSAYQQALSAGADPAQLQMMQGAYQQAKQQNAFQSAFDEAINAGGLTTPEGQEAFMLTYSREGGDPFKAMQLFKKDSKGETTFDKKLNEFKADAVISYLQGGDDASNTLTENLDYLEEKASDVGRAKGLVTGEFLYNSADFTEYRNRGNLVLDGVIKVFNKAGVLPQKKLEWIRETFAISPWDTQEQIRGKVQSLRTLAKDAGQFNAGLGQLIDQYGENIPTAEFLKLQKNMDKSLDRFNMQVESPEKEQVVEKLSTKGYRKGDMATDSETGQQLIFNGTRWVKKK